MCVQYSAIVSTDLWAVWQARSIDREQSLRKPDIPTLFIFFQDLFLATFFICFVVTFYLCSALKNHCTLIDILKYYLKGLRSTSNPFF